MLKKVLLVLVGGPIVLFLVLVAVGLAVGGPDAIHKQAEATRSEAPVVNKTAAKVSEWTTVQSWSGDGVTDTETFETKSR